MAEQRSVNQVVLVGHALNDADIAHVPQVGKDVADFGLATNEVFQDKNGEWVESAEYHDCKAWNGLAEKAERVVKRGNMLAVYGKLKHHRWEDKDGNKRKKTYVLVDKITLMVNKQVERVDRGPGDAQAPFGD